MADISKIKIGSATYELKDAVARQVIANISSPMNFLGVSSTEITDGGTEQPTIGDEAKTPKVGDVVVYNQAEFVYGPKADDEENCWYQFGDTASLGKFAYADTGTASYTPRGSVTISKFTPSGSVEVTVDDVETSTGAFLTGASAKFTGEASAPTATFSGDAFEGTAEVTPQGNVSVEEITPSGEVTISGGTCTPKGTINAPAFTGQNVSATTYATYSSSDESLTLSR